MSQSHFRLLFSLILLTSFNFTFSQNQQKFNNDELILKLKAGVDIHQFLEKTGSNTLIPSQFYLKRSPVPEWNIYTLGLSNHANPGNVIRFLSQMNEVEVVQRNHILSARLKPDDPLYSNQWFLNNDGTQGGVNDADIDADKAWNISTGGMTESGDTIVVCVIDDGVDIRHDDLRENLWFNYAEIPKMVWTMMQMDTSTITEVGVHILETIVSEQGNTGHPYAVLLPQKETIALVFQVPPGISN